LVGTSAFFHLGELYRLEGRFAEAETQYLKRLEIEEKVSGPQSKAVSGTLDGLAMAYQGQGKTSEAKQLLARVEEIRRNSSAAGDVANGGTLTDLGLVAENQGNTPRQNHSTNRPFLRMRNPPVPTRLTLRSRLVV